MTSNRKFLRRHVLATIFAGGTLCQLGSCNLGEITATSTVTLDGREVIVNMIRGAIITPLDTYITNAVNNLFDSQ